MIGDECDAARQFLEMSHPLAEGVVKNWQEMEYIWDYGFKKVINIIFLHINKGIIIII